MCLSKNILLKFLKTLFNRFTLSTPNKEQKMQTNLFEQIITTLPGNVYWKDKNGNYLGCNEEFAKINKLHSTKDIVGKSDFDFLDEEKANLIHKNDITIVEKDFEKTMEEEGLDEEGNAAIYLTKKVPLRDKKGRATGVVGISVDITDRKKMEKALKDAKEKAELANKVKTEFIRNIEHDIRTPLGGIWGMCEHLQATENENTERKMLLGEVAISAKDLLDYCNRIIDFARLELGAFPIAQKELDVRKLIDRIIHIEIPPAKLKKLNLVLDYDENVPKIIIGDEYRLERVLSKLNLILV